MSVKIDTQLIANDVYDYVEELTERDDRFLERTNNFVCYRMLIDSDLNNVKEVVRYDASRKSVIIRNLGIGTVYIGKDKDISAVTNSFPVQSGEDIVIDHTIAAIYAIAGSGSQQLAIMVE